MVGSEGRLDGACLLPGNRCLDDGVFCSRGVCKCTADRFVKNGQCGKPILTQLKDLLDAVSGEFSRKITSILIVVFAI